MLGHPPNPMESAPPVIGQIPPDSELQPLSYYTEKVVQAAAAEGMTPEDMRAIGAMLQGLKMIAQGKQQQGQPGQLQGQVMQRAQGVPRPGGPTGPYMGRQPINPEG